MTRPAIRRLSGTDVAAFRDIRLAALHDHPHAFGASWEEESAQALEVFADRLDAGLVLGAATAPDRLEGIACLHVPQTAKLRHKGTLWGMYVRPEARGTGLSRRIVGTVIDHARTEVEEVTLVVTLSNAPALALYRSLGFEPCGLEPRALKVGGTYLDELRMSLRFGPLPVSPPPG